MTGTRPVMTQEETNGSIKRTEEWPASRICAFASPPPKRRRKLPRPCKWLQHPSCAARRRRPRQHVLMPSEWAPRLLAGTGSDKVHLLIVCTGERGLCGPFNSAIVRLARDRASALIVDGKEVKIVCVGRKGYEQLRRQHGKLIVENIELRGVRTIGFEQADMIGKKIIALFEQGGFDVATLFFSRFKSVMAQIPTAQQVIPPMFEKDSEAGSAAAYEYEPEEEEILAELLPRNLTVQVFRALLENAASEQGARMSAMDNATRNAGEMIRKQTLTYNRTRQAMITKELIEIISGAEAL